jgi:hypothetical protein
MTTKHTNGEWYINQNPQNGFLDICFDHNGEPTRIAKISYTNEPIPTNKQKHANAKLIAAAPEMIAQLEGRERLISGFLEKVKDIANSDKSQTKLNEDFMFLVGGYKRTFENALKSTQDVINKTK